MKMVLKDGKRKTLTLSYDDGVVQDIRLIEIMNKYGIKGTFNVNSGSWLAEDKVREKFYGRLKLSEAKQLYINSGHEVAVHSYTHPFLEQLDSSEVIYEITQDRLALEKDFGKITRGMAYPMGTYSEDVIEALDKCGVVYSRTTKATYGFKFPERWLELHPTCHHRDERLFELTERFVSEPSRWGNAQMFYLWGHSYEFDNDDNWDRIEKFCQIAGGHRDIWYTTNIEIYDYVKAYNSLNTSYDKKMIHNPSGMDVWFDINGEIYSVKPGETIKL